jgi:hypothetical protein
MAYHGYCQDLSPSHGWIGPNPWQLMVTWGSRL